MKRLILLLIHPTLFLLCIVNLISCSNTNRYHLEESLQAAGDNRQQLEKVLEHFKNADDERSEAAQWLIANISGKEGCDTATVLSRARLYQIVDSVNRLWKEPIDSIVKSYGADYSNVPKYKDLMCVDSAFLVNDIESAFFARERWQWAKKVDFDTFRDFVLPYRVGDEALFNNSRSIIQQQLLPQLDSLAALEGMDKIENVVPEIGKLLKPFRWTGFIPDGPRLGSKMTELTIGNCQDFADRITFFFRAIGIPATTDKVFLRGNGNTSHFWPVILGEDGKTYVFEDSVLIPSEECDLKFIKVVRECFSGLRDVTEAYSPTPIPDLIIDKKLLYEDGKKYFLCGASHQKWTPIVEGKPVKNGKIDFGKVGTDRVAMISLLNDEGHLQPACEPFIINPNGTITAITPSKQTAPVTLFRKYTPELGEFADRMVGAVIEASDNPEFDNPDTLATISEEPYRLFTTVTSKSNKPYRYVRYRGADNSYCNIAELEFYTGEQPLPGKAIGTDKPWGGVTNRGIQAVFDGDPYTSFDYSEPSGGWVGLDLGNPKRIDKIVYTPRNRDNFIRTGDEYELFYWESAQNRWRSLGSKTATADSIDFQSPLGALLYLKNHTRGNDERIFLYDHNAKRQIFY